jgi:BirA family biotin operon repressor/biotin-[acetyl-CoA-carboxylase] ligase
MSDKQKKLLSLLADGEFHSGTQLAHALGISRSAVCKQISALTAWGLSYHAVSGKGYRLEQPLELLTHTGITHGLEPHTAALLTVLEIHDHIDSTNRHLAEQARQNAPSGTVCLAEHQTAGKGRRGRHWVSPFGSNLYLSVLWRFQQGYASTAGLSLAMGVAVIRALRQHHIEAVGLKWPNDIISGGKKLGGLLIEVSGESEGACVVVIGLGLNLFLPEAAAHDITQAWTDVSKIGMPRRISRNQLAASLLNHLFAILGDFESVGIKRYLDEWRRYDCLKDQSATLFIADQPFSGVVQGIDDNGLLLLQHPDGKVQAFASGEVSFSPPPP